MSNQYVFAEEMMGGTISLKNTAVPSGDPLNSMSLTYCPDTVRNIVGILVSDQELLAVIDWFVPYLTPALNALRNLTA